MNICKTYKTQLEPAEGFILSFVVKGAGGLFWCKLCGANGPFLKKNFEKRKKFEKLKKLNLGEKRKIFVEFVLWIVFCVYGVLLSFFLISVLRHFLGFLRHFCYVCGIIVHFYQEKALYGLKTGYLG